MTRSVKPRDISDILEAEKDGHHLDGNELATIESGELEKHVLDAGGQMEDGDEWVAFDCTHEDVQGYLTGGVSRIYVNIATDPRRLCRPLWAGRAAKHREALARRRAAHRHNPHVRHRIGVRSLTATLVDVNDFELLIGIRTMLG